MKWLENVVVIENNKKKLNEHLGRMDGDRIQK